MKASLATVGSRRRYTAMEVLRASIELVVKTAKKARNPDENTQLTT